MARLISHLALVGAARARADSTQVVITITDANKDEYGVDNLDDPPYPGCVMIEKHQTCEGGPDTCHDDSVGWRCDTTGDPGPSCSFVP